jgi:hypothetical protein
MSSAMKNGLMLVGLVAVLGLAAWFFSRGRKETTYPDDPSTNTEWMCGKCGKRVALSAAQVDDWMHSKDKVARGPNVTTIMFLCSDCKDFTVVRARVDPNTREWYIPGGLGDKRGAKAPDPKPAPQK